jgi:hypothetical protein
MNWAAINTTPTNAKEKRSSMESRRRLTLLDILA